VTEEPNLPVPVKMLTTHELAALAREVAYNIRPLAVILPDYGITQAQYNEYLLVPFFKNALEVLIIDWNKATSTEKRLQLQAQAGLEDALPTLAARMGDKESALPAAVETGKLFAKIAGIGEQGRDAHPGEKFSIVINLGEDKTLKFEKNVTPDKPLLEQKEIPDEPS